MTEQLNLNRIADACEEIAKNGGGGGGDTVSITPTLDEGTKIADFSINGQQGSLYAPEGGGSGGVVYETLAEVTVAPDATFNESNIFEPFIPICSALEDMAIEEFKNSRLIMEVFAGDSEHDVVVFNPQNYINAPGDEFVEGDYTLAIASGSMVNWSICIRCNDTPNVNMYVVSMYPEPGVTPTPTQSITGIFSGFPDNCTTIPDVFDFACTSIKFTLEKLVTGSSPSQNNA